ncbi:MAG TPA: glycosyltransferase family 4 protein [Patescibacteria group bacterium]
MKILLVTPYFYPKIGGLESYAYNIAKGLKKTFKWDVVVITSNHKNKIDIKEKLEGITIYRLAPLFKISNTPINPFWYFKMKKIITNEKPDIINAHSPVPFIADVAAMAKGTTPFILTYHALSLYKKGLSPFNLIAWVYKQTENYLFFRSQRIVVVSDFIKEKFPQNLKKKTIVISNFIRQENTYQVTSDGKKKNVILFISSLDKSHNWKGLEPLLFATNYYVKTYGKDITIIVIGEGNWKEKYESLARKLEISKYVSFVGQKIGKEKDWYLKNAKVSVIYPTSSNDALPTFLLESWAHSLPVIGSHILPLSKIIKGNFNGLLIKADEPKELAKAIHKVFTNKLLRQKLSKNGYETVKTSYLIDTQLSKFNSLLMTTSKI